MPKQNFPSPKLIKKGLGCLQCLPIFLPPLSLFHICLYFQLSLKTMVDRWISYCYYIIILLLFLVPVCLYVTSFFGLGKLMFMAALQDLLILY